MVTTEYSELSALSRCTGWSQPLRAPDSCKCWVKAPVLKEMGGGSEWRKQCKVQFGCLYVAFESCSGQGQEHGERER